MLRRCTVANPGCVSSVEYCFGNATTRWGRLRHADGHPAPYRLRFVELGNEQVNGLFVSQVAAMEERARELGVGGILSFLWLSLL